MVHYGFFCSVTAARIMGVPLPSEVETAGVLHVGVPAPHRAPRSAGIVGHKLAVTSTDIRMWHGLPITSPARTWRDLAALLSLPDLVAVGDFLLHKPLPLAARSELMEAAGLGDRRRGSRRLSQALPMLDGRAASRRESRLRVILMQAGITGFEINFDVWLGMRRVHYIIDIAFPDAMVAVEYQGEYHHDLAQWRYDMTRSSRLRAAGWEVIEVNAADLADPVELADRIRRVVRARRQQH
jgi:very-short-patch-repair endonuclease